MPTLTLSAPLDFRDLIADIAYTTEDQITIIDDTASPDVLVAQIELDNGYLLNFNSGPGNLLKFNGGSRVLSTDREETYIEIVGGPAGPGELANTTAISRLPPMTLDDLANFQGYFDGSISVGITFPPILTYVLFSGNSNGVISGFDIAETLVGVGRLNGRGGDDIIILDDRDGTEVLLDVASTGRATGGNGNDQLVVDVDEAFVVGGAGDDLLTFAEGRASAKGGTGADTFRFMSNFEAEDTSVKARIRDFDVSEDTIVFETGGRLVFFDEGDNVVRDTTTLSFAELFGEGDLSTLDDATIDGITYTFTDNSRGHSILTRSGTDSSGEIYDEHIILQQIALDEIDRADIFIAADPGLFDA